MICAGLSHNLAELFGGMSIVTFILITLGLMLIVVEFFQPSYRFPTVCGSILTVLGIVVRMLGGGNMIMLFFMVLFCAVAVLGAHMIMLATHKKAWLATSLALQLKKSVDEDNEGV